MDSFNFHDIRMEKANAISRYRRIRRFTTFFRFVELFVFLIIVSKSSAQFVLPNFKVSGECFREAFVALISPRSVFLLGNAIVIVLFLKSGRFSDKNGDEIADFYEEYVKKCRQNQEKKALDDYKYTSVCCEGRKICRSNSENVERRMDGETTRRRELRRSMTERCQKSTDCRRKLTAADEMSSEEFRRTVEAFIARQQRSLREEEEEEEFPDVVPVIES